MRVRTYPGLDALPPAYGVLLNAAEAESFYFGRPWFANLIGTATGVGEGSRIYGVEADGGGAAALGALIARVTAGGSGGGSGGGGGPRVLRDYADPYATISGPVLGVSAADPGRVLDRLASAIGAERPRWDVVWLGALDPESGAFRALADALRRAGFMVQTFFHFGNWYERVGGATADDYLAARPGDLRNTLRRKGARLAMAGGEGGGRRCVRFNLVTAADDPARLDDALRAYARVHAASWKAPEPFPGFVPGLVRAAAARGRLRLGTLWIGGEPAAAQIWIASAPGRVTIYKLAHDARFNALSVGSLLTLRMMRHALEVDRVEEVDFGRGDDAYKRLWLPRRRERWGIVAFNPRTPRGALAAARHLGGRAARGALARALGRPLPAAGGP